MADAAHPQPREDGASTEPLYKRVAKDLARLIVQRTFKAGSKMPEERLLVGQLKVSRCTVRAALEVLEAQGLVQRVANKGTYVIGTQLQPRWFSTAHSILLVRVGPQAAITPPPGSYYDRIYTGIERAVRSLGLDLKVENHQNPLHVPIADYRAPRPADVGGALICGTFDEQYINMFHSEGIPVVVIDYLSSSLETDCVIVDTDSEAAAAIEHLASRGHTSLGFVAMSRYDPIRKGHDYDPDVWRLLDALRRGTRRRRMEMRDEWTVLVPSGGSGPEEAMRAFVAMASRPTAVVCFDMDPVRRLLPALHEAGIRCPEEISVITRGEDQMEGRVVTCLSNTPELMGKEAVRLLLERMSGQRQRAVKVAISSRLVLGQTTGPAPQPRA